MPAIPVLGRDEFRKAALKQFFTLHSKQCGAGEIRFGDQPCIGERKIANGREIIEAHVTVTGFFQDDLSGAQLLGLHLQFDMLYLKFMQQLLGRAFLHLRRHDVGKHCLRNLA